MSAALRRSFDIVTSALYTLGTNTANHSRLDYEPYCSSYHRSISGSMEPAYLDYIVTGKKWDVIGSMATGACDTPTRMQNMAT